MTIKRFVVSVATAVLALGTLVAGNAAASTAGDYIAQQEAFFEMRDSIGQNPNGCGGRVWIGKTASGWIEGSVTVKCPGTVQIMRTELALFTGQDPMKPDKTDVCNFCGYQVTSLSEPGSGTWCARGYGWEGIAIWDMVGKEGHAKVCV